MQYSKITELEKGETEFSLRLPIKLDFTYSWDGYCAVTGYDFKFMGQNGLDTLYQCLLELYNEAFEEHWVYNTRKKIMKEGA